MKLSGIGYSYGFMTRKGNWLSIEDVASNNSILQRLIMVLPNIFVYTQINLKFMVLSQLIQGKMIFKTTKINKK